MKQFRFVIFTSTFALFLFFNTIPAYADLPSPQRDYTVEVGDGQYIFVMLSNPNDQSAYGQGGAVENKTIRAKYNKSGLYTTESSSKAVWTVDWYAFRVDISDDGKHLVRWGPWPTYFPVFMSYDEIALEFYENGELLISYQVDNLVRLPENLPHSVSHYTWLSESDFDQTSKNLLVRTKNGEAYTFDAATGLVIEGQLASGLSIFSSDFWLVSAASAIFISLGIVIYFTFRKRKINN